VQWVFAPVADVNNNADNPIINIRSYGSSPQDVSSFVKSYIAGAHSDPKHLVLVTAKHFPGHGDTSQDSHMELARLGASRERINTVELTPFRAAIEAGVDAIMTAHMAVPALDPREIPATVSTPILTDLLRNQMKFPGIIVTDAMDMQGVTKLYETAEAAVRALEAGADVLLMPKNADEVIDGVQEAIRSGRITEKRLDTSLERVLMAKVRLGLHKTRIVDLDSIGDAIDSPEAEQQAQKVADHAVTLLRDGKDMFPLRNAESVCVVALTENKYNQQGRQLMQELNRRAPKMTVQLLDPSMSTADLEQVAQVDAACSQIVVAAYVSVSAYRGNVALAGDYPNFLNGLLAGKAPVALVSLGNPYLLRAFPIVQTYATTYSSTPLSETALVKALFGEIPISGKLPVSIPGIAKYGDGIQLPAAAPKKGK
jgi:beta-N-acetylhexosaminidase